MISRLENYRYLLRLSSSAGYITNAFRAWLRCYIVNHVAFVIHVPALYLIINDV